ncbi:chondroitin sulfate synthase 1-like isoform X3 [Dysidea avara]|uniref:chondroitin sulfate synthase 1-like isoform X3 n=1 Tax=Dysidea avara TaxID=196820 RepID=UPI003321D8FA
MISVRRGPLRDAFLLFSGLLVGAGIVLYYPDNAGTATNVDPLVISHVVTKSLHRGRAVNDLNATTVISQGVPQEDERLPTTSVRPKTIADELVLKKTLFVGVVTAENLLNTRGQAIYETWGKLAPGVTFFSGEGEYKGTLPVVSLPGVDDTYPPQKKVYRMLKYMHDNYIDEYKWFLRADDDVYIRVPQLVQFLNTLDSSKMVYMGQPGMGKPEDLERIQLHANEHYCMGGTGVIYSNKLLKRLAPHLEDCLANVVVSYNEDLEVGRCISRRLDVQCTWSYEVWKTSFPGCSTWTTLRESFSRLKQFIKTKNFQMH